MRMFISALLSAAAVLPALGHATTALPDPSDAGVSVPAVSVPSAFADFRFGHLTMTNHYIHVHGYALEIAGTDGNWIPKGARWPEVTSDVAVGQMRGIEFTANRPGDRRFTVTSRFTR